MWIDSDQPGGRSALHHVGDWHPHVWLCGGKFSTEVFEGVGVGCFEVGIIVNPMLSVVGCVVVAA